MVISLHIGERKFQMPEKSWKELENLLKLILGISGRKLEQKYSKDWNIMLYCWSLYYQFISNTGERRISRKSNGSKWKKNSRSDYRLRMALGLLSKGNAMPRMQSDRHPIYLRLKRNHRLMSQRLQNSSPLTSKLISIPWPCIPIMENIRRVYDTTYLDALATK